MRWLLFVGWLFVVSGLTFAGCASSPSLSPGKAFPPELRFLEQATLLGEVQCTYALENLQGLCVIYADRRGFTVYKVFYSADGEIERVWETTDRTQRLIWTPKRPQCEGLCG